MPQKVSAGLLMYRLRHGQLEVFLIHPGGPYFRKKDLGCWSIPKGEVEQNESLVNAAIREFTEETGITPTGNLIPLGAVKQKSNKVVHAWAFLGDWDESVPIHSNLFDMEWPPASGKRQKFPEVDRAGFFPLPLAQQKVNPAQVQLLERLVAVLS